VTVEARAPGLRVRRPAPIIATIAIAAGTVGLISGVEGTGRDHARDGAPAAADAPPSAAGPAEARSYRDMQERAYGPNAALPAAWLRAIRAAPDLRAPVAQTEADRAAARARRAARRAYDGAPPVIPHPVDQAAAPACATCHEHGAVVAGLVAPVMSHAPRESCLQCHLVAADPRPAAGAPPPPGTTFAGLAPRRGERAWDGAPPTIPHATWMRERCTSCHGALGALGMKSTHPWRASCEQCHAPSAALDQRAPRSLPGGTP
jgi:nitrate reductase (cytochrome), electron transfer subunit